MTDLDRLSIRPLELGDVAALQTIISDARREYGLAGRVQSLLEPADLAIYRHFSRWHTLYFVALRGGVVLGGAGIAPLAGADNLTCELQRMYLRPDARGQGIGSALLTECLITARRFWFRHCYLETIAAMREALALYQRHGFELLDAPRGNTSHGHNDRWLSLDLLKYGALHANGNLAHNAQAADLSLLRNLSGRLTTAS